MMTLRSRIGAWLRRGLDGSPREGLSTSRQAGQGAVVATTITLCPAVGPALPIGQWPDDPNEVPAWRLDLERRANDINLILPSYRTRGEFEMAVSMCADKVAEETIEPLAPALPPEDSARGFLKWLRETDACGEYTDERLREAYGRYCQATRVQPSADAYVRKYLKDLGGVSKALGRGPAVGKRERPTIWTIKPSLAHVARKMAA